MSTYASVAANPGDPPPKEDIRLLIARQADAVKSGDLITRIWKTSEIRPLGISPHPQGLLLAFSSEKDRTKVLDSTKGSLKVGSTTVTFTAPVTSTPVQERGRRWRMSHVPCWLSHSSLLAALADAGLKVTTLKLETVPGHPSVRTPYATFWASSGAPPKTLVVEGSRMLIFDPVHQKAPLQDAAASPPEKSGAKEVAAPPPKEGPFPKVKVIPPKPQQAPSTPAKTPAANDTSPGSLKAAMDTSGGTSSPPAKKRKRSPLADPLPAAPPPASRLEEDAAPVTLDFIHSLGFTDYKFDAVLSIYEGIANKKQYKSLSERLPSPLGLQECCSSTTVKLPHTDNGSLEDWFVWTTRESFLAFASHEVQATFADSVLPDTPRDLFIRKGWVQRISAGGGHQIIVLFKSRMAKHDRLVAQ